MKTSKYIYIEDHRQHLGDKFVIYGINCLSCLSVHDKQNKLIDFQLATAEEIGQLLGGN